MVTGLGWQVKYLGCKKTGVWGNAGDFIVAQSVYSYISLFFTPEPNLNVWLLTQSIPDQAVTVWIMWSCYGNVGTMLIISNYTNRPQHNSV